MDATCKEILEELLSVHHRAFQDMAADHYKLVEAHIDVFGTHPYTQESAKALNKAAYEEQLLPDVMLDDRQFSKVVLDFIDESVAEDGSCLPASLSHLLELGATHKATLLPTDKARIVYTIERSFEARGLSDSDLKLLCDAYQKKIPLFVEWCRPPTVETEARCVTLLLQLLLAGPPILAQDKAVVLPMLSQLVRVLTSEPLRALAEKTLQKFQA
ncbi:hypothetical protein SPRG_07111 [Saprolegnia parasitica CBS 223.65]|uniref:Uncharacterized protein n=1 Tax=Saprolegnia parasitica (strain CBS 223.65) TaxID=695850 RepID=A0A067CBH2_SAPPC|nr:hypothetical protein SPRG_07111 [Saprolegnia parasitica CBS 223.65]KDO27838.1 hypothetical protein SPRG_07111 [Saprolegnia parasitica CBS 223.65]|eukprot:XP_012201298.1 hypothetical protein SPRG_07111 [Saprolegnia parasitica CBS 223.65]